MTYKVILSIVVSVLLAMPVAGEAGSFKHVKTEADFLALVSGKTLSADWGSMQILPNGKIKGKTKQGKLVGAWQWNGALWCRNVRIGKQPERGTDCQKIGVSGNQLQFIREQGRGTAGVMVISN
ncbi:hypothetical protein [Phaeobacter inhibens]|uniref:Uncharacterized protein n=1 Tax=Phaeobacter inhibens TaxID=221822 RepID=A0A2I7KAC8_9RHOB|nr:hypothetical protein [Phaeobacter inhibens]AUQ99450.1 hypothetical protein PhaeoP88_02087 [Phaeobacter inhibens]